MKGFVAIFLVITTSLSSADVSHLANAQYYDELTTTTQPPPHRPYVFEYKAGRAPGHVDRVHQEVSDGSGVVRGAFSYIDPRQQIRTVEYVADKDGFHPQVSPGNGAEPEETEAVKQAKIRHFEIYNRIAERNFNDDGGIEFFNTIVLQPHLKLVTDLGRGYHIRCRYKNREVATPVRSSKWLQNAEALTSNESPDRRDHGRSLDNNEVEVEKPMPGCHMKIYSGNSVAENVKIGDPLTLKINIDKQSIYGLHVTVCLVRDGLGWGEQKLVNNEGCPLDGEIMGQFEYSDDRSKATVSFPAHKFPYTSSVYYQCNVRLCALQDPECQQAPNCAQNRSKRDTEETNDEGHPATIEVYSGLYVNESAEVIDSDDVSAEKSPDEALCISQRSFAIGIAIAGLILMLAVVAAVLCIMARRHHKTASNSGSSIYSGPYTNTAFSHSS